MSVVAAENKDRRRKAHNEKGIEGIGGERRDIR